MRWVLVGVALAGFGGAFWGGRWVGGKSLRAATWGTAVLLGAILLRTFFRYYPSVEYALLPFDFYAGIHPWWVLPFAFAILGIGSVRMSAPRTNRAVAVFAAALFVLAAQRLYITAAFAPGELTGRPGADGVCRQTSGYSCGAAAASTLLARIGIPSTEAEMARLAWTNSITGTDEFSVCRALRRKLPGGKYRVNLIRADWSDLRRLRVPAMATMRYAFLVDHWVVVLETTDDAVVLGDPLEGRIEVPRENFLRNWRRVLVIAGLKE